MNFRGNQSAQPPLELNLTPLIDVVFLLLIFFMVSTTFDKQASLKIELPEAVSNNSLAKKQEKIDLIISQDGRYKINQKKWLNSDFKTLKMALTKAAKQNLNIPVFIKADKQVEYQFVVRAMDALQQIGLNHLIFSAEQPRNPTDYQ